MGTSVRKIAESRSHTIVAAFDSKSLIDGTSLSGTDVVIDFSHANAIERLVDSCCEARVNLVTGTTGWDSELESIAGKCLSSGIAMVHAANFSPGATMLFALARQAAKLASTFGGYEAAIEERHHAGKKDSPSGTALRLAAEVRAGSDDSLSLPIAATRSGHEFGIHRLFFDSPDDVVELSHTARNRDGFARGAVIAAEKLTGRQGVFTFEELILGSG